MTELEEHYNKFCEEKRLSRRHGMVEYVTSMKYIHKCLEELKKSRSVEEDDPSSLCILDVGAGTGRYSIALAEEGYDVTAVELVKYNLGILKSKNSSVKAYQGNVLKLSRFQDNSFDLTLLFGPMYHLYNFEDKCQAMQEAKRVTKSGGRIMVAYLMNEYGVLLYGFRDGNVRECLADGRLNKENFHCVSEPKDLYEYVRIEDIDQINQAVGLTRELILTPDGPANYMRQTLNAMDQETFDLFIQYHLSVCERQDLIGAAAHTLDILQVE